MFSILWDRARVDDDLGQKLGISKDLHVYYIAIGLQWYYVRCSHWHLPCDFRPSELQHHNPLASRLYLLTDC